jgi:hypothetical protein
MGMTRLECDIRQQAVEQLLKKQPEIAASIGGKMLGISKSAFLRYKHKLQNENTDRVYKVQADGYKRENKGLKDRILALEKELLHKTEELSKYVTLSENHYVSDIKVQSTGKREVVPVIVASDWHIEETVNAAVTNGHNEYNLKIAEDSIRQFFSKACNAIKRSQQSHTVNTVVLALLGDIINGVLRAEDLESNQLTSIDAVILARNLIYNGIKALRDNTGCNLRVLCCVGNHGRLTEKIYYSNQVRHSLEFLIYKTLEKDFEPDPSVTFKVSEAYYIIQPIFGVRVRFHHGHAARFNGGIGGLAVPVIRKTQQMNTIEHADLDVIGHFHSANVLSNVIVNGSLVGSNGFSMSLGMPHDIPKQTYFEIDSKYGRTVVAPICIDRKVEKYVVDGI